MAGINDLFKRKVVRVNNLVTDYSRHVTITETFDSETTVEGAYLNMFDGDVSSYFGFDDTDADSNEHILLFDYGEVLDAVTVQFHATFLMGSGASTPTARIRYSKDNSTWTDWFSEALANGTTHTVRVSSVVSFRYIQFQLDAASNSQVQLRVFDLFVGRVEDA